MPLPDSTFSAEGARTISVSAPISTPVSAPVSGLARSWKALEHALDSPFGPALNPLKHLGALGFMLLWLLVASGVVLFIVIDTSAAGAYQSIAALQEVPLLLGVVLRGIHRYGADAFVLVMFAHMLREWMLGRYRHWRKVTWWTGVPLIALAFVSAVGGFWLNWDTLGQYSVEATAQWMDALPFLASPMSRNFLGDVTLGDRLFTLFVFIHIGIPVLLVFGLWFHIQRINLAKVFPPRPLAWGVLITLILLSALLPIQSQGPADLRTIPTALAMDWVLLFIHPLMDATSPEMVWVLFALAFTLLILPPLLPGPARQPVAQVYPEHCSGCGRCFDDCPYSAITMVAHPNGKRGMQLAQVREDLCASCGICAGACPSSTPFRSTETLVTGIDMPQWPVNDLRQKLVTQLKALPGPQRWVIFACGQGGQIFLDRDDVLHFPLVCAAALPPSFVEYALRAGATGVLINGCGPGGCEFRLGQQWTQERLSGIREPYLRPSVNPNSWHMVWTEPGDEKGLTAGLEELRRKSNTHATLATEEIKK